MVAVPPPPNGQPLTDKNGRVTNGWANFFLAAFQRIGGGSDKVQAAYDLANAASPATHLVNAGAGLDGGGTLTGDVTLRLYVAVTTVATLPASAALGAWAFATDGRNSGEGAAAGTGCPVCWNGSLWRIPGVATAVAA